MSSELNRLSENIIIAVLNKLGLEYSNRIDDLLPSKSYITVEKPPFGTIVYKVGDKMSIETSTDTDVMSIIYESIELGWLVIIKVGINHEIKKLYPISMNIAPHPNSSSHVIKSHLDLALMISKYLDELIKTEEISPQGRISKEEYYMNFAKNAALRSTCTRRQVGAVAVKDGQIISTGYNGAPCSTEHCLDVGCLRDKLNIKSGERMEVCRAVHAEQNVIAHAAKHGVSLKGASIYITHSPCITCAKMIINAGITKVVYSSQYPDNAAFDVLADARVETISLYNK